MRNLCLWANKKDASLVFSQVLFTTQKKLQLSREIMNLNMPSEILNTQIFHFNILQAKIGNF